MNILISGSAGFIFSNFVIYGLQDTDWNFISIDKLTYAGSLQNVPQNKRHKLYVGDICDEHFVEKIFELEKPDVVIHGCAETFVDSSIECSDNFIQTNVVGTHTLLNAARKYGKIKKFININTDEVIGSLKNGSAKENCVINPRNPYSASKASAELIAMSYFYTYGLPIISTRCCNVFGPRQHCEKLIPKIIYKGIKKDRIPIYGDGKNVREWIYVKDKYFAIKTLIEKGKIGEVYNISSNQEKTNLEVVKLIMEFLEIKDNLIDFVKDRLGHDFRYSVDCSKLKLLGWEPQFNFEEALKYTVSWYKNNTWAFRENK